MNITAIRPSVHTLALSKPYTIAYDTYSGVELVFLEIELANGITGIGSASPAEEVVAENARQTHGHLQAEFVQSLVGRDIRQFRQILAETRRQFPGLPGTQAALDLALHDAFGQYLGVPVAAFYGQSITALPTSVTVGIKNIDDTLEEVAEYGRLGFTCLKLKTGNEVDADIEKVLKIREQYGQRFSIRVDANQGYSLPELRRFLAATENAGLELIEQPLPVGRESELLALSAAQRKGLAADESLTGISSAFALCVPPQPFGIFNIKLMKCGGIFGALEIAQLAQAAQIDLFWGCNDESVASIAAALHAAYACPNTRYLDLDGSFDLLEDLVSGGFVLENGLLRLTGAPGLGIRRN
ncbi:MAG: dipeptide epimerase [Saprospiraceae bacterium]|nr:dipeptide epimerase [Saprospiraceae bacterium]